MNILLWILQVVLALFFTFASVNNWRSRRRRPSQREPRVACLTMSSRCSAKLILRKSKWSFSEELIGDTCVNLATRAAWDQASQCVCAIEDGIFEMAQGRPRYSAGRCSATWSRLSLARESHQPHRSVLETGTI